MFISVLELFKIGIGPSSSHTMGPMLAAGLFLRQMRAQAAPAHGRIRCTLQGSLAHTGRGHGSDRAVLLGLHGHNPRSVAGQDVDALVAQLQSTRQVQLDGQSIDFEPADDIVFDTASATPRHPNTLRFDLLDDAGQVRLSATYYSIGGGFVADDDTLQAEASPMHSGDCPYPFATAAEMVEMAENSHLSIAQMKWANETARRNSSELLDGLDGIWQAMRQCTESGLRSDGELPGPLHVRRRAGQLARQLRQAPDNATLNDWLSAYAMAVNEENAAGHLVVTAPTNGAAGVIPALLYHFVEHQQGNNEQVRDYLLTAAAVGGLIKHRSSISGAEVGCQGEVGSAAAMAAAGLCAVRGGSPRQVENAAEIALEHHLGMTCDPVGGLVQVPCIERNAFGAIKAHTAASLALRGDGSHIMPLDACIAAMKQTGLEMSDKYKETSLGGLAVSITEC